MMRQYTDATTAMSNLYKNELQLESNCLIPCSFTEYQVKVLFRNITKSILCITYNTYCIAMKFAGLPLKYSIENEEKITLTLVLNPIVQVSKEEEAYPIRSLVADVGGILGLFIGFNFLMIFDWVVVPFKRCREAFQTRSKRSFDAKLKI